MLDRMTLPASFIFIFILVTAVQWIFRLPGLNVVKAVGCYPLKRSFQRR